MLFFTGIPLWLLVFLTILVGLASGCVTIGFAFIKESVPPRFAGTAAGIYNMGAILGAMILQPAIGWLLDLNWQGRSPVTSGSMTRPPIGRDLFFSSLSIC